MLNELKPQKIEEKFSVILKQSFKDTLNIGFFISFVLVFCVISNFFSTSFLAELLMGSLFIPFLLYKKSWIKNKITLKNFFNCIFSIDRPIISLSMVFILIFNLINSLVGKTEEANNSLLNVLSPVTEVVSFLLNFLTIFILIYLIILFVSYFILFLIQDRKTINDFSKNSFFEFFENKDVFQNRDKIFELLKNPFKLFSIFISLCIEMSILFIKMPFKSYLLLNRKVDNHEIANKLFKEFLMLNCLVFFKTIIYLCGIWLLSLIAVSFFLSADSIYYLILCRYLLTSFFYIWIFCTMVNLYHLGFGGSLIEIKEEEVVFEENVALNS